MNILNSTIKGMLKSILILLALMIVNSGLSSQTIIKGTIDPSLKIDSFKFAYTTNYVEHQEINMRAREIMVKVVEGEFYIQLDESPDVFYTKFYLPKNYSDTIGSDYKVLGNYGFTYLLQTNSELTIQILPCKISFLGDQKYLMECQMELWALKRRIAKKRIKLGNSQGDFEVNSSKEYIWQYLSANKELHDSSLIEAKAIVSNYAMHLDEETRSAVYYNYLGNLKYGEINQLNFRVDFNNDTIRKHIIEYYNTFHSDDKCPDESEEYLGQSNMYPKYLAYKTLTDIVMRLRPLNRRLRPDLLLVDRLISERYSGDLYDQVSFSSFLNRGKEYMEDLYFETLLGNIKNDEYLEYIREVKAKRSGGQEAYHFELEDENGRVYTNTDFKGKVILLDFWFAGCMGCIALHKNMLPVKEHFKDNPNFVYLSISTDDNKKIWEKSLAGGLYTEETDVKLWLGNIGRSHPIIKYYDINSYPTMIIIDGNNKIVSMNPPNPYTEHNKNSLINIIEEAINQ